MEEPKIIKIDNIEYIRKDSYTPAQRQTMQINPCPPI